MKHLYFLKYLNILVYKQYRKESNLFESEGKRNIWESHFRRGMVGNGNKYKKESTCQESGGTAL